MDTLNNRILIIDDNTTIHEDFRKVLEFKPESTKALDLLTSKLLDEKIEQPIRNQLKYEIDFASQGKEGINLVQKSIDTDRPYTMAFVDFMMPPGYNGIETIKHIWAIDPFIQIAICTAYSDYSWEEITNALGDTDKFLILKKPFDNIEIRQIACCLVAKWNLSQKVKNLLQEQAKLTNVKADEPATKRHTLL